MLKKNGSGTEESFFQTRFDGVQGLIILGIMKDVHGGVYTNGLNSLKLIYLNKIRYLYK